MTSRSKRRRPTVSTLTPPRQRTRDMDWHADREFALTVTCPAYPKGCRAPIGTTCRNRHGDELVNQPAHDARLRLAEQVEPTAAEPAPDLTEEQTA